MRHLFLGLLLSCSLFAEDKHWAEAIKPCDWVPPCERREWTMTYSTGLGYRRDRQKFAENLSVSYLQHFDSVQLMTTLSFAWERLILKLAADYGWMVDGTLAFKGQAAPFVPTEHFSPFQMGSGYVVDVYPSVGCRIKFWTFDCGSFSFIPALGYTYSHFNTFPRGYKNVSLGGEFTTLVYSRPLQQDWFGPSAEGRIAFSWRETWRVDWFYQYTLVYFRQTLEQVVANFGAVTNSSRLRISSKADSTRTQLGGMEISYRSCNNWQVGALWTGSSTWSNTAHSILRIVTDTFSPASSHAKTKSIESLSVNWTRYILNFYASYWF